MGTIRLQRLDENWLVSLTNVAVAEADPVEVMPPMDGPSGWTKDRVKAFGEFHRKRAETPGTHTYVIMERYDVIGSIRLDETNDPKALQTGLWLARSARGKGFGTQAVALALTLAKALGATSVAAETTADNLAAQAAMRHNGAILTTADDEVSATFPC